MRDLLRDLYGHQEWADAQHWAAFAAHAPALADARLRERIHHILLVQRYFLSVALQTDAPELAASTGMAELRAESRRYHADARRFVEALDDAALERTVGLPWFQDPPLSLTLAQALQQCAMHSHYHRGQNATRLRELGGEPPLTDLIIWWWKGRPAASWD